VTRILTLIASLALLAAATTDARADHVVGRPGAILAVAPVVGSHYNPCAPGGLYFSVLPGGYPCWQAYLGSSASPTVGRSPRLPRGAQRVTVTRSIHRWWPGQPMTVALQRTVTGVMGPRTRAMRFPAWAENQRGLRLPGGRLHGGLALGAHRRRARNPHPRRAELSLPEQLRLQHGLSMGLAERPRLSEPIRRHLEERRRGRSRHGAELGLPPMRHNISSRAETA
jgi:hypothetical protein